MRLEATGRNDVYKVWMTDTELEKLRRYTDTQRDDLIIQLGGYAGFRAFEIPPLTPGDVQRTEDGDHYRLRVKEGKDTTGNGGKPRNAYLPREVEADLHRYTNHNNIHNHEEIFDLQERGVRDVVKRTAKRAAEETGNDDYRHVSSHDLRRRFAQRLLVDQNMNPRVVMAVGGWDSFAAIEPYLNAPTPSVVNKECEQANLA